eukprot:gb/GECG01011361.1/.p1 GENE.gb/GECG01011361.1/~~gb/GECG01011361.1/.p1  ORF type:complete len:145 (+),score=4.12 gb/GECG01011361.1/:1-435(+)
MRHQHHALGSLVQRMGDGRQRPVDSLGVRNHSIFKWYIKVHSHKDPLLGEIDGIQGQLVLQHLPPYSINKRANTHTHLHKKARLQTDQWMYENFRPRLDNPVCIPVLCQPEGQLHTRQREGEPRCRLQQIARRLVVRYTTIRDI